MQSLPRQLSKDEIPGSAYVNRLLVCIKSLLPVETPTIRPVTTPEGTGYEVKRAGGGGGYELDGPRQDNFTYPEGTTTADTDLWAIDDQGTNQGVIIPVMTRVVYDDAGDEILYGFYRTLTFDVGGRLVGASAEIRYTVDTPVEDCT